VSSPIQYLKQSKYFRVRAKKYEYRCCNCGCDFRLLIVVEMVNSNAFETREAPVPDNHDPLNEVVNGRSRMDKEVSQMIVELLEQNQFSKNFVPKRIMSELRRSHIAEERIPSWIQIQNKLPIISELCSISIIKLPHFRIRSGYPYLMVKKQYFFVYDVDNTNRLLPTVQ